MICDQRIKAGIVSGAPARGKEYKEGLASLTPRLFMQLQGSHDGSPQIIQEIRDAHAFAKRFYEEANAKENLILRIGPCEHHFLDEFKWEAFYRLKRYFGFPFGPRETLLLADIIKDVVDRWDDEDFSEGEKEELLKSCDKHQVIGNRETLVKAFGALFTVIKGKYRNYLPMVMRVKSEQDNCHITVAVPGGSAEFKGSKDCDIMAAERGFIENNGLLRQKSIAGELRYTITFSNLDS
jgi:hypothetical protein